MLTSNRRGFMIKIDQNPPPEHIPTLEETEAIKLYRAFLLDGWIPQSNQWVNDSKKGAYFLVKMQRGDQVEKIHSPIALPIANLSES